MWLIYDIDAIYCEVFSFKLCTYVRSFAEVEIQFIFRRLLRD